MTEKLGSAALDITANLGPLNSSLAAAHAKTIKSMVKTARASKAAMGAAFLGVGVAVGIGLNKIGKEFEEAYNTIRVGTGATGKALEGLKDSFRAAFAKTPASTKDTATAIADLNTRLGLTGKELSDRAVQFLNLAKITKTDVKVNIERVSKAFEDWEVATGDQEATLDGFFRVSQASGISVDGLAAKVQQFGSPLRQVGFSLKEAAAMFGEFEKAGVNVETLMPGIKMTIANIADPTDEFAKKLKQLGINTRDPKAGLEKLTKVIGDETLPAAERTSLAMDLFGKRAGSDMKEAIEQGRFSLEDMVDVMENGKGTINETADETLTFSEKLTILKKRGMLALEKPAMAVVTALTKFADGLLIASDLIAKTPGPVKALVGALALGTAGFVAFTFAIGKAKAALIALKAAMLANPYVAIAAATIAIGVLIVKNWDAIKEFLAKAWEAIKKTAEKAWAAILKFFKKWWPVLLVVFTGGLGLVVAAIIKNWDKISTATKRAWDAIKRTITDAFRAVTTWVRDRARDLARWLSDRWDDIRQRVASAWRTIRDRIIAPVAAAFSAVRSAANAVRDFLGERWDAIRTRAASAWQTIRDRIISPIEAAITRVKSVIGDVVGWLKGKWDAIVTAVGSFGGDVKAKLIGAFKGAANAVIGFLNEIIGAINVIPGVPDIGKIAKLARGGSVSSAGVERFARGGITANGRVNRPTVLMGEDAPKWPEWVIPTNPAYRKRAQMLLARAAQEVGLGQRLAHYATGGRTPQTGGPLDAIKDVVGAPLGLLKEGAGFILGKLPSPGDFLPAWLGGMGKYVIDKVTGWIKDKVGGLLGGGAGIPFGGGLGGITNIASRFGLSVTSGFRPGDPGWHGKNRARDYSNSFGPTPEMLAFASYMIKHHGSKLLELIYTPLGSAIKNGAVVPPYAQADHYDHVHVAMAKGGLFGMPFLGSYGTGGVLPADGMYFGHSGETVTPPGSMMVGDLYIGGEKIDERVEVRLRRANRREEALFRAGVVR